MSGGAGGSGGTLTQLTCSALQFSGPSAEQMRKTYSEFCSRHTKALKLYKELFARDKRFQQFIRVSRSLQDPHPGPVHGARMCPSCVGSGSARGAPHGSRTRAYQHWAHGVCPRFPAALP